MPDTSTARPQATAVQDSEVCWFGASERLIGGRPDSRYGWLDTPEGPCIVKALDPGLSAYASTLLQHERRMLQRLHELHAPVPALVDLGRPDWLATRFGGLSLQRLAAGPDAVQRFPFAERLSAWQHLLRRLQPLADKGVLVVDLYSANVVLPLARVTEGQLRLQEALLIDHAHTLEAGMNMRRPIWLDRDMQRIAPELREALRCDQEALTQAFLAAGADLPGRTAMPGERDDFNRRAWVEYDVPQELQRLLDTGDLSRDHAMQYAAGTALQRLLPLAAGEPQALALQRIVDRMRAARPGDRFASLGDAAQALSEQGSARPLASQHRYGPLQPQDLLVPPPAEPDPSPGTDGPTVTQPRPGVEGDDDETVLVSVAARSPYGPSIGWLCAALALGAVLGVLWPLMP